MTWKLILTAEARSRGVTRGEDNPEITEKTEVAEKPLVFSGGDFVSRERGKPAAAKIGRPTK